MQQKPQPQAQPQATAASNAAEEALKRNTDCVYFLASPLTCKKGAECEYRHSELARVNPRDCWYWLNGNCLNAKCAFRHPPLDGMLVPQALTPSGPSFAPFQTAAIPVSSAPHNCSKQTVPCIFFQKGFCLKGDRCPFSHGPVINSKGPQGPVTAAAFLEPSSINKPVGGLEKCSVELKVQETNICEATEVPLRATPISQVESVPVKDQSAIERHVRHPSGVDVNISNPPKYRQTTPPIANGNFTSRPSHMLNVNMSEDQDTLNSKDADEISREFSPGFDVLVDDELRDADYYHHEDHYERTRDNEGSYLNQGNDNDIGHSADYDSLVDVDQDAYRDPRRYDSFDQMRGGQYGRDQCQVSSERILGISEMRQYSRDDSPGRIDGSDLRYHLSKHRKVNNGLRSVISHDLDLDRYGGNHSYRDPSHRDTCHLSSSERFVGDRLWGRIKLPGRSMSPHMDHDLHCEREIERGNGGGRLSPERVVGSVHHRRLQDRLKGRVRDDLIDEGRSIRGLRMRERLYDKNGEGRGFRGLQMRERSYDNNINFASPKSLAELRVRKNTENDKPPMNECQQAHPLGKRRHSGNYEQSGPGLSFPGPKPLSEILKRKRAAVGSGEDSKQNEEREDSKPAGRQSLQMKESKREEGLIVEDNAKEDLDPETYSGSDGGENKYEQVEGEEYYNEDQVENADAEYTEDDDDGDDFAKKIGVMFS